MSTADLFTVMDSPLCSVPGGSPLQSTALQALSAFLTAQLQEVETGKSKLGASLSIRRSFTRLLYVLVLHAAAAG